MEDNRNQQKIRSQIPMRDGDYSRDFPRKELHPSYVRNLERRVYITAEVFYTGSPVQFCKPKNYILWREREVNCSASFPL